MKKIILLLFSVIILAGCSAPTAFIMKDYEGLDLKDKNLTLVQLFEKPLIENPDDVTKHLGEGTAEEVYMHFFIDRLTLQLKWAQIFNEIDYIDDISNMELEERDFIVGDTSKIKIKLPKDNTVLDTNITKSDYILFLDDLQINSTKPTKGVKFLQASDLIYKLNFAIWDNTKGNLVSYGIINKSSPHGSMSKENWRIVIKKLAAYILDYSPFAKPSRGW